MSDKARVNKALMDANTWIAGKTFYDGQEGWLPTLAILVSETESQQRELAAKDAEIERLREELAATNRIITATAGLLQQWEPDYPSDYDKDLMLEVFRANEAIKKAMYE